MENYECELCQDTGLVPNYYYDEDSHQTYEDGTEKCICKLDLTYEPHEQ